MTEPQHIVTKALDALQAQSPANAGAISQAVPRLRNAREDRAGLAEVTRELFVALAPRDDVAAAEVHWHTCASVMARLEQDFALALRRAAEALLDRRMLEATLSGSYAGRTPTEQDVVLTVCFQPDACDACREAGGYESGTEGQGTLRFTVAEAREQGILPHRGCRNTGHGAAGFCRCRYKAVEGARESTATRGPS